MGLGFKDVNMVTGTASPFPAEEPKCRFHPSPPNTSRGPRRLQIFNPKPLGFRAVASRFAAVGGRVAQIVEFSTGSWAVVWLMKFFRG